MNWLTFYLDIDPAVLSEPNNPYPAPPGSHPVGYSHSHQWQPVLGYGYPQQYPLIVQPSQWCPYPPTSHTQPASSLSDSSHAQAPGQPPIFDFWSADMSHLESQSQHMQYHSSPAGLAGVSRSWGQGQLWQLARDQQVPIGQTASQQAPDRPALPASQQLQLNSPPVAPVLAPPDIPVPTEPLNSVHNMPAPSTTAQSVIQHPPPALTQSPLIHLGGTQSASTEPEPTELPLEAPLPTTPNLGQPVHDPSQDVEPYNTTSALPGSQSNIQSLGMALKSTKSHTGAKPYKTVGPTRMSS